MSLFSVSLEKEKILLEDMRRLGIREEDLRETFVRSSGPGGQKVNKTATCVMLAHIPTGLSVKCQQSRSQSMNRFLARRRLAELLDIQQKGITARKRERIEKIRRQKRRRSRRAKEKMLQTKHRTAEKKARRKTSGIEQGY